MSSKRHLLPLSWASLAVTAFLSYPEILLALTSREYPESVHFSPYCPGPMRSWTPLVPRQLSDTWQYNCTVRGMFHREMTGSGLLPAPAGKSWLMALSCCSLRYSASLLVHLLPPLSPMAILILPVGSFFRDHVTSPKH